MISNKSTSAKFFSSPYNSDGEDAASNNSVGFDDKKGHIYELTKAPKS
jgi:hypothetical protein